MFRFAAALLSAASLAAFAGLLIAGGTLDVAADRVAPQRPTLVPVSAGPKTLVVPQVTGQAYVFAKGILQDGGFAWRVLGTVKGYARQHGGRPRSRSPGSVVLDTGAPTITLTLARNAIRTRSGGARRPLGSVPPARRSCCRATSPRRGSSRVPARSSAPE